MPMMSGARPLVIRVGDLLREPGSRREIGRTADLGPLETTAAKTIPGTDLSMDGQVMAMSNGVEITGEIGFDWYGECRRCLDEIHGHQTVAFREVAQRAPIDDEVLPIDGDLLDLEPLARELVLAGLPIAPLCADDCAGPDPARFPTTTEEALEAAAAAEAEQRGPAPDPRWAALADIEFDP